MRTFRIIHSKELAHYKVQQKKRFLFWTWWSTVQDVEHIGDSTYAEDRRFGSYASAKHWILRNYAIRWEVVPPEIHV